MHTRDSIYTILKRFNAKLWLLSAKFTNLICSLYSHFTFQLVHDAGVSLHLIVIVYFIFAVTSILMLTFILPPHSITLERLQDISQYHNTNVSTWH